MTDPPNLGRGPGILGAPSGASPDYRLGPTSNHWRTSPSTSPPLASTTTPVVATCVFFPIFSLEYLSKFRTDILQQIFCNKHILHMYSGHFSGQTGPPAVDNPLGGTCHPAIVPDSLAGPDPAHGERGGDTPNARGLFPQDRGVPPVDGAPSPGIGAGYPEVGHGDTPVRGPRPAVALGKRPWTALDGPRLSKTDGGRGPVQSKTGGPQRP